MERFFIAQNCFFFQNLCSRWTTKAAVEHWFLCLFSSWGLVQDKEYFINVWTDVKNTANITLKHQLYCSGQGWENQN